jgi:glutamate-1-semialdehyde 2,1-aminomutase
MVDADGKEYIDYQAAFGPIVLGHNHPEVNSRVRTVMEEVDLLGVGTTEYEIQLASKICEHVPSAERVLFCNSGSEATYSALRLARAVTSRPKIIKFQGCYHGWHDSVAMNVISPAAKLGHLDPISAGSLGSTLAETLICRFNDLEDVERTVKSWPDQIAAVILEPVPHNIGCVLPEPGFLEGLRAVTKREGILLVFDEVITGFRHSLGGYQKVCGVTPDLTTLGKAMANGYPISAICGKAEFMDRFTTHPGGDTFFAGTFNGHPYACAASLATIEILERPDSYEHMFRLGDRTRAELRSMTQRLDIDAVVSGFGSVFVLYFMQGPVRNYDDLLRNDAEKFVAHRRLMMEHGVFQLPMNLKRNHISLSHTDQHIDRTLEVCEAALRQLVGSGSAKPSLAEVR